MLTDTKARTINPDDKPLADGVVPGLRLLPSPTKGRGKWQLRFVSPETGNRRDMGLGTYPERSIARARKVASEARSLLADGVDPLKEKKRNKEMEAAAKRLSAYTFESVSRTVFDELKVGWRNRKHQDQWINTLQTYAFPAIGERQVSELKPEDFAAVLRPIWMNKPETATRVKQRCHTIMKWSWAKQLVSANPLDVVDHLLPKHKSAARMKQHHPAMPWPMIPQYVESIIRPSDSVTAALLEFVILTAARSGEARAMTWGEVDFETGVWTVPAERMKAHSAHRVPLTARVIAILQSQRLRTDNSDLVFPSPRGKVLTDMALTKFLRDHKCVSDTEGRTATAHGFRSSFRDWASEHGYSRDLAERALAHTIKNQAEAAYHRTDLLDQRRPMMEAWSEHVTTESV